MTVYLAGPMTGYPLYNFPAFDAYQYTLEEEGYTVISPAELDRQHGFDPERCMETNFPSRKECARRDVDAICKCDELCVMPGWEKSRGCKMEIAVAEFLGIPIRKLNPLWVYAKYNVS